MPKSTNQLRIIGGQWRGRKLPIADVDGLRPTGDRIRETLFNWLMHDVRGSACIDLFSGSGALGLEAASRGADQVWLLEKDSTAVKQLKENTRLLNARDVSVVRTDALSWLSEASSLPNSIDLVFMDPPFASNLWQQTIVALEASSLLKPNAMIYIESPKKDQVSVPLHWEVYREKTAGDIRFCLYQLV